MKKILLTIAFLLLGSTANAADFNAYCKNIYNGQDCGATSSVMAYLNCADNATTVTDWDDSCALLAHASGVNCHSTPATATVNAAACICDTGYSGTRCTSCASGYVDMGSGTCIANTSLIYDADKDTIVTVEETADSDVVFLKSGADKQDPTVVPRGSDILTDGGLEIWTDPNNLTNWAAFAVTDGTLDQESTIIQAGTYSAKMTTGSDGGPSIILQTKTGLTAGATYNVTYYARDAGNSQFVKIVVFNDDFGLATQIYRFSDGTWQAFTGSESSDPDYQSASTALTTSFVQYTSDNFTVPASNSIGLAMVMEGDGVGGVSQVGYLDTINLATPASSSPAALINAFDFNNISDYTKLVAGDDIFSIRALTHDFWSLFGDGSIEQEGGYIELGASDVFVANTANVYGNASDDSASGRGAYFANYDDNASSAKSAAFTSKGDWSADYSTQDKDMSITPIAIEDGADKDGYDLFLEGGNAVSGAGGVVNGGIVSLIGGDNDSTAGSLGWVQVGHGVSTPSSATIAKDLFYAQGDIEVDGESFLKDDVVIGAGGAGIDYTLTFDGEDSDGVIQWMEDEGEFTFTGNPIFVATGKIQNGFSVYPYSGLELAVSRGGLHSASGLIEVPKDQMLTETVAAAGFQRADIVQVNTTNGAVSIKEGAAVSTGGDAFDLTTNTRYDGGNKRYTTGKGFQNDTGTSITIKEISDIVIKNTATGLDWDWTVSLVLVSGGSTLSGEPSILWESASAVTHPMGGTTVNINSILSAAQRTPDYEYADGEWVWIGIKVTGADVSYVAFQDENTAGVYTGEANFPLSSYGYKTNAAPDTWTQWNTRALDMSVNYSPGNPAYPSPDTNNITLAYIGTPTEPITENTDELVVGAATGTQAEIEVVGDDRMFLASIVSREDEIGMVWDESSSIFKTLEDVYFAGKVGIGTSTFTYGEKLAVNGVISAQDFIGLTSGAGDATSIGLAEDGDNRAFIEYKQGEHYLKFGTVNATTEYETMFLLDGKVGIGTDSPDALLDVEDTTARTTNLISWTLGASGTYSTTDDIGGSNGFIYSNGNGVFGDQVNVWHYGLGASEKMYGYSAGFYEGSASSASSRFYAFRSDLEASTTTGTTYAFYDDGIADYTLSGDSDINIKPAGDGSSDFGVYISGADVSGTTAGGVEIDAGVPGGGAVNGAISIGSTYAGQVNIMSSGNNAPITLGSGLAFDYEIVSGDYSVANDDFYIASRDDGGDRDITLPDSATSNGRTYIIFDVDGDASTYPIKIVGQTGTVNGLNEVYITQDWGYAIVTTDNSFNDWYAFGPHISFNTAADQARLDDSAVVCNNKVVRVAGDGGAVVLDTNPAIADGSNDGQLCTIQGTHDTNTVTINDGDNVELAGGVDFTLGKGDTLTVTWDSGESTWFEVSRSNN